VNTPHETRTRFRAPVPPIHWTLFAVIAFLVLAGGGLSIFLGYQVTTEAVVDEVQRRVEMDLRTEWALYDNELQRVRSIVKVASLIQKTHDVLSGTPSDLERIRTRLETIRTQNRLDVLTVVDRSGRVVLRTRSPYRHGDEAYRDAVLRHAMDSGAAAGTVVVSAAELEAEGDGLAERARIEVRDTPMSSPTSRTVEADGMMLKAAEAVTDDTGRVIGWVYGAVLVNRNFALIDSIRDTIFKSEMVDGKPLGTVTLFQGDVRVATNVLDETGSRAIGTRISKAVHETTIEGGKPYHDRAFVVTDWYITAYDPIRDPDERVVGVMYVGVLEKKYLSVRNRLVDSFLGMSLAGVALALGLALALALWLSRPIHRLTLAARQVASGDLHARVEEGTGGFREIRTLCRVFNRMADRLVEEQERIGRVNQALAGANENLKQLNENYLDMLEFVTHELKSPLASAIFGVNSLKEGFIGSLRPEQQRVVEQVERNLEYLNGMIQNYLNLSRIEKDELRFNARDVSFRTDVVEPSVEVVTRQLVAQAMRVECLVPDSVHVRGDPDLLRVVLDNLLSNAIKYGRRGTAIRVGCQELPNGVCRFHVMNEGRGIPQAEIGRLFQKFSRLSAAELRAKKGTGLGLFITRMLVDRHGGRIWAESRENEYTTFYFEIPLEPSGDTSRPG
jgi:two-component system NtrC family sensor kinase